MSFVSCIHWVLTRRYQGWANLCNTFVWTIIWTHQKSSKTCINRHLSTLLFRRGMQSVKTFGNDPILRLYDKIKHAFRAQNYLIGVKNDIYRTALAKLRSSSHTLAIESGRHCRPKVNVHERLCEVCQCVEDKLHFMLDCRISSNEQSHYQLMTFQIYLREFCPTVRDIEWV